MSCRCRCHVSSGNFVSCDLGPEQPGGNRSCSVLHGSDDAPSNLCERCGAFGTLGHSWVEGDCVLPHRNHSQRLVTGTHVCEPCTERWADWLAEILDLYATLGDVLLAGSVPDDTAQHKHQRKAPASPSPLRLDAWALLHNQVNDHIDNGDGTISAAYLGPNLPNIPEVLTGWAQAVFDALAWTHKAPDTVSSATAVLRGHTTILAGLPDVDTFDAELRWVRKALRDAHGLAAPKPLGSCLTVGCTGRVWPDPAHRDPQCDRCRRRYGTNDLVRLKWNEASA